MTEVTQLPLNLEIAPAMGRLDFMVGACNRLAVHVTDSWPNGWGGYPCAIIYGPHGCGKSHLAHVWQLKSGATIVSAAEFGRRSINQLMDVNKNIILDQLELIIGERDSEEKLFHLYNFFLQNHLSILAMSLLSPAQLEFEIPDLRSRLRAVRSAAIDPPDDELMTKVIAKRLYDQNFKIDSSVIGYILARMERSWEGLDKIVDALRLYATAKQKGEITKFMVRDILLSVE